MGAMTHYIRACCEERIIVPKVNFAGYKVNVPGHPLLRVGFGVLLVIGGLLGFLPVVGFWMVPLGLLVLSVDFPPVRRFQAKCHGQNRLLAAQALARPCQNNRLWRAAGRKALGILEASPRIELGCKDLQSSA